MKRKPSFRTAVLTALLVAAVVPVLVIGLITLAIERRNLSDHVGTTNLTLARSVAREVAGSLREPQSFIEHVGKVMGRDDGKGREQAHRLREEVRAIGLFESVYLLDRHGRVADVVFAQNVPASSRDYLGMDLSNLPVIREALDRRGLSRSAVFLSSATGDPAVMLAAPAGEGVVVGTLGLRVLSRIAEQVKPDDGGSVIIVSRLGKIIGHADYALVHRQTDLGGMEIVRAGLGGAAGTHTYAIDGVERLGSVVQIPETGWLVIVEVPLEKALAPVKRIETIFWFATASTILLAFLLALVGRAVVLRPMTALVASAREIARGNYAFAPPPPSFREVDELVESFSAMTDAIRGRERELRDRNEELAMTEEELRQQVDEYQLSQDHLTESEERYRLLVDSSPDAILIHSAGRYVFANPAALSLYGADHSGQLVGRPITDFVHPDSRQVVAERIKRLYEERKPVPLAEQRIVRLDGAVVPVDVIGIPFTYNGEPAVQVVLRDITRRKLAEDTIARARDFYVKLFDEFPLPVWRADAGGYCNYHNRTWISLTGRSSDEEAGTGWVEGLHPDDRARCLTLWQEAYAARRPLVVEYRLRRHDGQYRAILDSSTPYDDLDGEFAGFIGACVDITDRKEAEEEVRRLNAELEQRVKERTILLETANRELESFSYSVSHDLRAPLRHIDGFSAMLMEDCCDSLPETATSYLEKIKSASRRMGQLIDDLLDLSRVSRSAMRRESIDMSRMVRDLAREYEEANPSRKVTFEIADGVVAEGDPLLLRVALHNLLDNAWKYTGKKDSAHIRFGETLVDGERVIFVSDDGAGFDMRYVDKLFGPFQRLHSVDEFEGTGIGLATVQRIAQRHGGRAWAEGEEGRGATFFFTIP